jgi:hypothetical protein
MDEPKVYDFLDEFVAAFRKQLESDQERWGNTFLKRTRNGQEERTIRQFNDRFDKYLNGNQPIPWMKIAGDAYIAWVREQHPEIWPE